jgi:colicin import membrane protein
MPAAADRAEFAPPPQPGRARAFALAVLAHVLLMLALTWGITWNNDPQDMSAEAELWASVPKEAAPAAAPPPAPVVQAPPLQPAPPPTPPEPKVEPPAPPVVPKEPDIAVQQEKRKQEEAERRRLELERQKLEARKREEELERERKLEARKKQEEAERKKLEARKQQEEQEKRELAEQKAAAEKKRREEEAKIAKARQEAERAAALRKEQIDRMQRLAQSGTGGPQSTGTAARSQGPSDSYAGRIRARVRPNIVFTDDVSGNPTTEVEVRMAPDGTITSKRVVKSSGVKAWDEAVIRALDKTEVLPRDVDGRVHSPLTILFRPKG